jgi:hypothetical protein
MSRRVVVVMEVAVAAIAAGALWLPAAGLVLVVAGMGWIARRQIRVPDEQCAVPGAPAGSSSVEVPMAQPVSEAGAEPALG